MGAVIAILAAIGIACLILLGKKSRNQSPKKRKSRAGFFPEKSSAGKE